MLHKLRASDEYSIHSPFLFEFYNQTVAYHKHFYQFDELRMLRKELLQDATVLDIEDFGAGSQRNSSLKRQVKDIARNTQKQEFIAKFLFKVINHLQPRTSVELGTSLGLTSLYIASSNSDNILYTIEASSQVYDYAIKLFEKENANNIIPILGNIDEVLPVLVKKLDVLDFVFFDANHTYEATLKYFHCCLEKVHEGSVFVFDDIYWSPGMYKAWKEIYTHPDVMISVDFFYFGMVFFRRNQPKQHFYLKI